VKSRSVTERDGAARRLRAILLAAGVVLAAVATASVARADCTPAAADNVTATCSGTTTNQEGGAPGTSAGTAGYGTGVETGVTVGVVAGAGNTVTGTTYGISLGDATATNNASAGITGGVIGINANTGFANVTNSGSITGTSSAGILAFSNATVTNNTGAGITGGFYGIRSLSGFANVTNSGSITGTSSAGIFAATNATVTNNTGASITSGFYGIRATAGFADVTNYGSITGTNGYGIYAQTNATVTNNAGASISGGGGGNSGIFANTGSANVTNSGSITGTTVNGILANNNVTVTNNAGASITGGLRGIYAAAGFADVTNSGSITGTGASSYGIFAGTNATVTNNAGASITGGQRGIAAQAGGSSVFNAGTISGGTAAIVFSGVGNTLTLAQGSAITGNVLGTGSDTLQLGGTGSATFDVSQLGAAAQYQGFGTFNKIDGSTWTLTGTSTFAGPINVNGGTLSVNGNVTSASGLTVNSGGTLGGTGTVGNTTIASGGTLAPGNSIGTLNVNGNLTLNSGSNYNVEVSPSSADRVNVTGTATLGGATVNASFAAGSYVAKQYTILNATTSVTGAFGSQVNINLPSGFNSNLSYDANNAYLNLALSFVAPPSTGLSGNQSNVGNALVNYFNTNGGIPLVFGGLTANGLSQASGQPGASTTQTGSSAPGQFVNAVFGNAFGGGTSGGGTGGGALGFAEADNLPREAKDAYAAVTPRDRKPQTFEGRWSVFASVYGGNNRVGGDATAGTSTTTSRTYGTVVGADYRFTRDTQAGFALGGAGSSYSIDGGFGGGKAQIFNAAVYGRHDFGAAYVAGALSYSWQDTTTDRTVTISGIDRLHASFKAQALAARLEGGWRYAMLPIAVTPYGAVQSTSFFMPAYGETATSGSNQFALSYASKTTTNVRTELGAKFDKAMLVQGGVFTLSNRTAWARDSNTDASASATFQSLPGATFTTNGAQPSANAALVSLGAEMGWHNGWTIAANVDGEFSRTTTGYAGKGSVKYAW
jgi:uncharacterized protein with beta-barrel porin domain